MEINQKVFPVAGEPVLLKVGQRKREAVVDTDEGGGVPVEFLAEPFGKATASPVPAWTGRRLNLFRRAGALGDVHPEPPATGFGRHRAGIVDADVAFEMGHVGCSPAFQVRFGMVSCFGTRIYRQMRLQWIRIQLSLRLTPKSGSSKKFVRSCPASTIRHL